MPSSSYRPSSAEKRAELSELKSDVNLVAFACYRYSFKINKSESSQACFILQDYDRRSSGSQCDKLVVTVDNDNHWIYFNVHNQNDNGSIVDLIQNREPLSIGEVRVELRRFLGRPAKLELPNGPAKPKPTVFNRPAMAKRIAHYKPVTGSAYLRRRGIDPELLSDNRFSKTVLCDSKNNIVFPHYDDSGVTGYELKLVSPLSYVNARVLRSAPGYYQARKLPKFSMFARGGVRSVWYSACFSYDKRVVLVESGIEALSYHLLYGDDATRYISCAGNISGTQQIIVSKILLKSFNRGLEVVCAFNNDEKGREYSALVQSLAPEGRQCRDRFPPEGQDWNDLLLVSQ